MTQKPFENRFEAGIRSKDSKFGLLEKDRIGRLFGAAGNLHMIIFELLFKKPSILKSPTLFELFSGDGNQGFAWTVFNRSRAKFAENVARFFVLDTFPEFRTAQPEAARDEDLESVGAESVSSFGASLEDNLLGKIQNGVWILEQPEINHLHPALTGSEKVVTYLPENHSQLGFIASFRNDAGEISILDPLRLASMCSLIFIILVLSLLLFLNILVSALSSYF